MGNKKSKPPPPPDYPPIDNIFIPITCSGFTRIDYTVDKETRLAKAPFLMYNFSVSTFRELQEQIDYYLSVLPIDVIDEKTQTKAQPSTAPKTPVYNISGYDDSTRVYGPVYLLIALNIDDNTMECYLYFPSMQKNGKPWGSYYMLSFYHRWMYTIMYSSSFSVKPFTSCFQRKGLPNYTPFGGSGFYKKNLNLGTSEDGRYIQPVTRNVDSYKLNAYILNEDYNDIGSLPLGCVTVTDRCTQSDSVHRAMNIYDDRKNNERMITNSEDKRVVNSKYGYPMVYFRSYMLNYSDPRIVNYFNRNSFDTIQINSLAQDFELIAGCANMLVSNNFEFFLILESRQFCIYRNKIGKEVLSQCMNKIPPTQYGTITNTVKFGGGIETRMIIEDSKLNIYSKVTINDPEKIVFSTTICNPSAVLPITLVLDGSGKMIVYDALSTDVTASDLNDLNNKAIDLNNGGYGGPYDPVLDMRQRMFNLKAYLKLKKIYVEPIKSDTGEVIDGVLHEREFPKYDEKQDYIMRYNMLIEEYIARGVMTKDDPYAERLGSSVQDLKPISIVPPPVPSTTEFVTTDEKGNKVVVTNTAEDPYAVEKARVEAENKRNKELAEKKQKEDDDKLENEFKMIISDPTAKKIVSDSNPSTSTLTSNADVYQKTEAAATLDKDELNYLHSKIYDSSLDLRVRMKYLIKYFADKKIPIS